MPRADEASASGVILDPLLDLFEFLNVSLEHLDLLLELLVVLADLVDAVLVFVAASDPGRRLLALLAADWHLRTGFEVLFELFQGEAIVALLLLPHLALEGAGEPQWRLLLALGLQVLDHGIVFPRLRLLILLGCLDFSAPLVLACLSLRLLLILRFLAAVTGIELNA